MSSKRKKSTEQAYVVAVDMGYGHQRAAYPLSGIAACPHYCGCEEGHIINANNYHGIPGGDRGRWDKSRHAYELISRMKKIPFVGDHIFSAMDYFQRIESFYPKRDLSEPSLQLRSIYKMIHQGWGKHLIDVLNVKALPLITSFFIPAFFAEEHGYKGDIYAICTDTDVSRAWAPLRPKKSRIRYLVPNKRVRERLKLYGVDSKRIYVTGFPLPKENIGGPALEVLKQSLACRISNLDPQARYQKKYQASLLHYLGERYCNIKAKHPLNITFAVGGAGAQRSIGVEILKSLHTLIDKGRVSLNLVAGSRKDVYDYYTEAVRDLHIKKRHGGTVRIIYNQHKLDYFGEFNKALLDTDILWTKPSELSFYAALGLPIIIAPSIGSQEEFNRSWLHSIGAGFEQEDPRYTHEWLFDWLDSGWLAEAAMKGFLDAPRNGVYHIEEVALKGLRSEIEDMHLL
ncbi:MAG: hypothetical protein HYY51_03325 [Candidatus Magasanikbacteria bacterium]|nr:hypothetical protein [Candidatus Magasanikbacteria bacterium]